MWVRARPTVEAVVTDRADAKLRPWPSVITVAVERVTAPLIAEVLGEGEAETRVRVRQRRGGGVGVMHRLEVVEQEVSHGHLSEQR